MTALVTSAPKKRSALLLELQEDVGGDLRGREGEAADVELEDFAGLEAGGEVEGEVARARAGRRRGRGP